MKADHLSMYHVALIDAGRADTVKPSLAAALKYVRRHCDGARVREWVEAAGGGMRAEVIDPRTSRVVARIQQNE